MKLLLVTDAIYSDWVPNFQRLPALFGHTVIQTTNKSHRTNPATLELVCKKHGVSAVIINTADCLKAVLEDTADFIPPPPRHAITLDDYAGSMLHIRESIPAVVLNPFDRLVTVPYEKFVVDRYVSKLTKSAGWFKQTTFKWAPVTIENATTTLARMSEARLIGIDIETAGTGETDPLRSIRCVSYTCLYTQKIGTSAVFTTESYVISFEEVWQYEFIQRANATSAPKVFQNGLYDNAYFLRWNCPVHAWLHDTQHLFHSWLSELPKRLDFIASFSLRDVRYWKQDGKRSLEDLHRYCALDSWATVNAYLAMLQEAPAWAIDNYMQEFPMVFPALTAALEGLDVDIVKFRETVKEVETDIDKTLSQLRYLLDEPDFNPNSSVQTKKLFTMLGLGALGTTNKAAMLKAKASSPLNNFILTKVTDCREYSKLTSTYLQESKLWDSRLYYTFNPAATDTGRLNSTASSFWCGFQIQNIPRGVSVKQFIRAPKGWYIAEADKAQSEARCVGYLSGDTALINLVESPHDYHSWNASAFFGVSYKEIYDEENHAVLNVDIRDLAKRTNHGANYNMGPGTMLDTMGPTNVIKAKRVLKLPAHMTLRMVCQYLLTQYERTYPKVKQDWYAYIIKTITTTRMLVSPFGWTRRFFSTPSKTNKPALNAAVAHAPQNLSVRIINEEWYKIWRETIYGQLAGRVRIKAQIHDSLLFIYKTVEDAQFVLSMMQTSVKVRGVDGKVRVMRIPTDLSTGKKGKLAEVWGDLK